jgi:hypothetical protein
MWADMDLLIKELRRRGHHAPERFEAMLAGDVTSDDISRIRRAIAIWGCRTSIDTITLALLRHRGIDHAVLAHAASLQGAIFLRRKEDGRPVVSMNPDGKAQIHLAYAPGISWVSGFDAAGQMHRHDDLDPILGVFAMDHLPDSVVDGLAGRPLADVVSHPALDAMDLTIAGAAQSEYLTLIQPRGHSFIRMEGLTSHLAPNDAQGSRTC